MINILKPNQENNNQNNLMNIDDFISNENNNNNIQNENNILNFNTQTNSNLNNNNYNNMNLEKVNFDSNNNNQEHLIIPIIMYLTHMKQQKQNVIKYLEVEEGLQQIREKTKERR